MTGVLYDLEYVDAMRIPNRWTTVEKMVADPILFAGLTAIKQPIMGLDWHVEPGADTDLDKQIAQEIEEDLFDLADLGWSDYLTEALSFLEYGIAVFERVWEYRDRMRLVGLGPRPPKSIAYWHVDGNGRPDGMTQMLPTGGLERFSMTDILPFTFGRRGGFWTGTSILRAAYKPWLIADKLTRVEAIAVERNGVGIPSVELDDETLKDAAEQALMTVRGGEKNFVVLVPGMRNFKIMGVDSGSIIPADPAIRRHELNALRALGTEFVAMGGDATGSRAMHTDKVDTFLLRLNAVADYICDVHNRHLFPDWVRANHGRIPSRRLPKLVHSRIDVRDLSGLATALAALVSARLLTPDQDIENELRAIFDLSVRAPTPASPAAVPMQLATGERSPLKSEIKFEALGIKVNFAGMAQGLDRGSERIAAASATVRKKQIQNLIMYGRDVMRKPDPYRAIAEVQPRFVEDLAGDIQKDLNELYDLGMDQAREELNSQGASPARPTQEDGRAAIAGRALVMAGLIADQIARAWAAEMLTQARAGALDEAALRETLEALSDKSVKGWASRGATEALAIGRQDVFDTNADKIGKLIYTCLLDTNSCGPCASLDGEEFDPEEAPDIPNPECEGGDLCRCQVVAVAKD